MPYKNVRLLITNLASIYRISRTLAKSTAKAIVDVVAFEIIRVFSASKSIQLIPEEALRLEFLGIIISR